MAAVIKVVKRKDDMPVAGGYLVMFDHNANFGQGELTTSSNVDHALRFSDKATAEEFVERTSRWRPSIKEDGSPNKPLTAYKVEIEDAP